jgi:hypothetical protein
MDKTSLRWGFVLILFAMLGAFLIPVAAIPRLALSAHTVGLLSGLLLIAFGAITPALSLELLFFDSRALDLFRFRKLARLSAGIDLGSRHHNAFGF